MATPATVEDLMRTEKKAELVAGRIIRLPPMGSGPGHAAGEIAARLYDYERRTANGGAYGPCLAYVVPELPSGRQSFCPDASYHFGPWPDDPMSYIPAAPAFAVEVKVAEDYESDTEPYRASRRADYFRAGTLVVWDVDSEAETVAKYTAADPAYPTVFRRGDAAEAEPALPGWRLPVDDLFA